MERGEEQVIYQGRVVPNLSFLPMYPILLSGLFPPYSKTYLTQFYLSTFPFLIWKISSQFFLLLFPFPWSGLYPIYLITFESKTVFFLHWPVFAHSSIPVQCLAMDSSYSKPWPQRAFTSLSLFTLASFLYRYTQERIRFPLYASVPCKYWKYDMCLVTY